MENLRERGGTTRQSLRGNRRERNRERKEAGQREKWAEGSRKAKDVQRLRAINYITVISGNSWPYA